MASKNKRIQKQSTHHLRLINYTTELLPFLCDSNGEIWSEIKMAFPRGSNITGFKSLIKKIDKLLDKPYK